MESAASGLPQPRQSGPLAAVVSEKFELPQRVSGTHLPAAAYRVIGTAKVPNVSDDRWRTDEQAMRVLLNGLRRWQVNR